MFFSFQSISSLFFRLSNVYCSVCRLLILPWDLSILLLSPSIEFFFWLLYFSIWKFPFGSSLHFLIFAKNFYFFICFKHICNCSIKYFYDGCFKSSNMSNISVIYGCQLLIILFFFFVLQFGIFLILDRKHDFWLTLEYWELCVWDSGFYLF